MTVTVTAPGMKVDPGAMPSPPDPEVSEKAKPATLQRRVQARDPARGRCLHRGARSARCCAASGCIPPTWLTGAASAMARRLRRCRASGPQARRPDPAVLGDNHPDTPRLDEQSRRSPSPAWGNYSHTSTFVSPTAGGSRLVGLVAYRFARCGRPDVRMTLLG